MPASNKPLLHICHAPADHGWVHGRMLPALGLAAGQYRTRADDTLGEFQLTEIERAVEECCFTVLIASSAARWDRLTQLAARLAQHTTVEHKRAEPEVPRLVVIARDFAPGSDAERRQLPLAQRALVGLDCTDEERTAESLARLRRVLGLDEPAEEPPACPYPGLERFTAKNRHLLFGRDRDREAVLRRIRTCHTRILVLGPSGSGKSSLIHAAVLPRLRPNDHLVQIVSRGGDLATALRASIDMLEVPCVGAAFDQYLMDIQGAADAEIETARVRLRAALAPDARRRVVVVDPLEEIFADDDAAARSRLFQLLGGLWSLPWCTVILCMRADFYGALMAERCWRELEHSQYPVASLDEAGLRAAIIEPAKHAGAHVEAALVERLIREIDRDRSSVPLPLLQVALKELWERLTWRYLTLASYERIMNKDQRGLAAVLAVHADGVLQALTAPGDREMAQRILLDLVHLGEGRPHTRRRRTLDELRRSGDDTGQLERVLDSLSEGRLVITGDGDPAGPPGTVRHVDLAHDVLITGWAELASWVKERQGDLVKHRHLEARAGEWVEAGRKRGLLDEGNTAEARAWRDSPGGRAFGVSEWLVELIAASEAAHMRARREKEEMIVHLLDEQRKTRESIAAAVQVADEIVFQVDNNLRTLAGASRVSEVLLARSRTLLGDLSSLGGLDRNAQRTELAAQLAQADFARERGRLEEAYRLLGEVHEHAKRQADADHANTGWQRDLAVSYNRLGDVAMATGKLDEARAWFEQGLAVHKTLSGADPANAGWQRDLSVSYNWLGDVAVAAGQLDAAHAWFERSLVVSKTLIDAQPTQIEWQRDLSVSYGKLGDVAVAAGQLDEARAWFEQSLAASKSLAAADPAHAGRQYDLSVAYNKLGNVAVATGKLDEARVWFVQGLTVRQTLAGADPAYASWQRDLSVSYNRLGDVALAAGKLAEARAWFERSLVVRKTLASADPAQAEWQRDLSVSYDRLGDVAAAGGQFDDARAWFEQSLAVSKALADADSANAGWQRDLAVSYDKLASVAVTAGRLHDAHAWFEQSLGVSKALADADPANAGWQRDLAASYNRLGDVAVASGKLDEARAWFELGLGVNKVLSAVDPVNAEWRRDLAMSYDRLGDMAVASGKLDHAHAWFEQSRTARKSLADAGPTTAEWQRDLLASSDKLDNVAVASDEFDDPHAWFERSPVFRKTLASSDLVNAEGQRDLLVSSDKLDNVAVASDEFDDPHAWFEQEARRPQGSHKRRPRQR